MYKVRLCMVTAVICTILLCRVQKLSILCYLINRMASNFAKLPINGNLFFFILSNWLACIPSKMFIAKVLRQSWVKVIPDYNILSLFQGRGASRKQSYLEVNKKALGDLYQKMFKAKENWYEFRAPILKVIKKYFLW